MATRKKNQLGLTKYDSADYIKDELDAHYYLAASLEGADIAHIVRAMSTVCRALGVAQVAKRAGLTRDGLYKALAEDGRPSFATITGVLKAFNIDLLDAASKTYQRESHKAYRQKQARLRATA